MSVSVLKRLLSWADEEADKQLRNDERDRRAAQKRDKELKEAQEILKSLQYKVDVMERGHGA